MSTKETRAVSWFVGEKNASLFDEDGYTVSIVDEAGGEFLTIRTGNSDAEIRLDACDWPALRAAIDHAASQCREVQP